MGIKKMNPIRVRLFVVTQSSEMCLTSLSDADGTFAVIDSLFQQ